jgi:hypothetical protein
VQELAAVDLDSDEEKRPARAEDNADATFAAVKSGLVKEIDPRPPSKA